MTIKNIIGVIEDSDLTAEEKTVARTYAIALDNGNFPVIFDLLHLSQLAGMKHELLMALVGQSDRFYREFKISKRSGGTRTIAAPYPSLREVQRWVLDNVLIMQKVHSSAFGFIRKRSIRDNAQRHLNATCILKIDIKEFFPTITLERVLGLYKSFGYTHDISYFLASISTLHRVLPQGAPTSPAISNGIAYTLDSRLHGLSKKMGLTYTRYADDMVFSGENIRVGLIKYVTKIINEEGFSVNDDKTRLIRGNKKKIVTGVSVSSLTPKIPKATRRALRAELHAVLTKGFRYQMEVMKIRDPAYPYRLIGKISFWASIERDNDWVKSRLNELRLQLNREYQ